MVTQCPGPFSAPNNSPTVHPESLFFVQNLCFLLTFASIRVLLGKISCVKQIFEDEEEEELFNCHMWQNSFGFEILFFFFAIHWGTERSFCSWGSWGKNTGFGLPFPPLVGHVWSELFAISHLTWMALHCMAHNFIELHKPLHHDKAVIHKGVWSNNGKKQRGTKEPLDEGEREEWKSWLKTQHSKN